MAQRFRFNLQTALDVRGRTEDQARLHFANTQRVLQEAIDAKSRILSKRAEILEQMRTGRPDMLLNGSRYLEQVNQQLAGAQMLVEQQLREVEARRQELLVASREREALNRLRERRRAEHDREVRKAEERELDVGGRRPDTGSGIGMGIGD